jgi:hypothetical protein
MRGLNFHLIKIIYNMKILLMITLIFYSVLGYSQNVIYDTIPYNYNGWTSVSSGSDSYIFYEREGELTDAKYNKYFFENPNISIEFHTSESINIIIFNTGENDTIKMAVRKGENLGYNTSKGVYLFSYTFKENDLINVYDIADNKNLIFSFNTSNFNTSYLKDYQISNDILIEFIGNDPYRTRTYYVTKTINQTPTDTQNIKIDVMIYPNPVENELYIKTTEKIDRIDIINENGGLVKSISPYNGSYINTRDMKRGLYIVNIIIDNQIYSYKIIKN